MKKYLVKVFATCGALEALFDETPEEFVAVITEGGSLIGVDY